MATNKYVSAELRDNINALCRAMDSGSQRHPKKNGTEITYITKLILEPNVFFQRFLDNVWIQNQNMWMLVNPETGYVVNLHKPFFKSAHICHKIIMDTVTQIGKNFKTGQEMKKNTLSVLYFDPEYIKKIQVGIAQINKQKAK